MIVTPDAISSEAIALESFISFKLSNETLFWKKKHFELFESKM